MFPYIIIDIAIVLILVFFAWSGARKGLILTLFGLLGLVVAIFGARYLSATFYEPVADIIQPGIYQGITDLEEEALISIDYSAEFDSSVESLVEVLREKDLLPGLVKLLDSATENNDLVNELGVSAAETLSDYLANMIARVALFILSFLVILLLWFLISRALDLAFKLPILSAVNLAGGLILGLLKAVVIVVVLVWVCQLVGWLPAEPTTPILKLFTPQGIANLLNRLVV